MVNGVSRIMLRASRKSGRVHRRDRLQEETSLMRKGQGVLIFLPRENLMFFSGNGANWCTLYTSIFSTFENFYTTERGGVVTLVPLWLCP